MDFSEKKVTVMGLGVHGGGLGTVKWLYKQGSQVTVTDLRDEKELTVQIKEISDLRNIKLVFGEHKEEDFINADIIIRNPAVPRNSKYLQLAKGAGATIEMDSSIFFNQFCKENIIGVTGSKGKTTTAQAIAQILDITDVGTEGSSPLEKLDDKNLSEEAVFELSSWRLEALNDQKISPATAILTSIYKDHLNTYESFSEYKEIKKSIIKYQEDKDIAIFNVDDDELKIWAEEKKNNAFGYSMEDRGFNGIFIQNENVVTRIDGKETTVMAKTDIPLKHTHEIRNILPGILLAVLRNTDNNEIQKKVKSIVALPHRMETVRTHNGVEYINDSASTMPDATIAALQSLSEKNIVHIVGGNDKKLDWKQWAKEESKAKVKEIIWLPGNASEIMQTTYAKEGGTIKGKNVDSMQQAVELATKVAKENDVVLLSPAATSFGSFKNEFDRGNIFRDCVNALK
jgi:UDP-N-acetylmuramoylalanine--D-glutamate ligase